MVDADDLLKVVLVLVAVWIVLEILETVVDVVFGPFDSLVGLLVVVLIALFLLDRI